MMGTKGNEYYYAISGLGVPKHEVSPTLERDIEFIMEWVPQNADTLPFLQECHSNAFVYQMQMLKEMLDAVYARWLSNDAAKIIKVAGINDDTLCRKMLMPFIVKAHTLAIDLQMAQKNAENAPKAKNNHAANDDEAERYRDVINSLSIIADLLEKDNAVHCLDKILDIAENISELQGDASAKALFTSITTKNIRRIQRETQRIKTRYWEKLHALNRSAPASGPLKKVLIVDDMPEVLSALTLMLEQHFQVIALSDGAEALALIDAGILPDAMMLDVDMPIMDGFTLAREIRRREGQTATPILFLTSNSTKEMVIQAFQCNAANFIVKPASRDIIISRLQNALAQ